MTRTIDVHQHFLPDFFWRETNEDASPVGGIRPAPWTESSALAFMDDAGIDVAVLSLSTPGFTSETCSVSAGPLWRLRGPSVARTLMAPWKK